MKFDNGLAMLVNHQEAAEACHLPCLHPLKPRRAWESIQSDFSLRALKSRNAPVWTAGKANLRQCALESQRHGKKSPPIWQEDAPRRRAAAQDSRTRTAFEDEQSKPRVISLPFSSLSHRSPLCLLPHPRKDHNNCLIGRGE